MQLSYRLLTALLFCCLSTGLSAEPLRVFTSIAPLQYLVDRIGGESVQNTVLVKPGETLHTFSPSPRLLTAMSDAKILFRSGSPDEQIWLEKVSRSHKNLQIIDLSSSVDLTAETSEKLHLSSEASEAEEHHSHNHHDEEHHHNYDGELDPHFWTSPPLLLEAAQTVQKTLAAANPDHASTYLNAYEALASELNQLDQDIHLLLADVKSRNLLVFHPSWGYFAAQYDFQQLAIETGGKMPSAKKLIKLIEHAKTDNINALFVQPQINPADAKLLAKQIGAQLIVIDPLAYDYINNLRQVAQKLANTAP